MQALSARFQRLGVAMKPNEMTDERMGVLNPACARLRDGSLELYPRMVAPGNISRIGSFRARERADGSLELEQRGYALEPSADYERSTSPLGYGCEDPRVTYINAIDRYVMAYVAFGPRCPEVAVAVSRDGLQWERLGLMRFRESAEPFADKDAAFFPEPIRSPSGMKALAFYHRPTLPESIREGVNAAGYLKSLPREKRECIYIGYVEFDAVQRDISKLCTVVETHRLPLPPASWGCIKVGAGTPPVRVREGWLAVMHGVDLVEENGTELLQYCAGILIHDAENPENVVYRSPDPVFVPEAPGELYGAVGHVVFPTAIDPRPDLGERTFDIYYGMADYAIGRGRLVL